MTLRRNLLAAASTFALLCAAPYAYAQETPTLDDSVQQNSGSAEQGGGDVAQERRAAPAPTSQVARSPWSGHHA